MFLILFLERTEGVVCSMGKAHRPGLCLPRALLQTSCGFIELFCDNIVPSMTMCVYLCDYVQILSCVLNVALDNKAPYEIFNTSTHAIKISLTRPERVRLYVIFTLNLACSLCAQMSGGMRQHEVNLDPEMFLLICTTHPTDGLRRVDTGCS